MASSVALSGFPEVTFDEIRAWYEAWNAREWDSVRAFLHDRIILDDVALGRSHYGKDDYMKYCRAWVEAFPDGRIKIEHILGHGVAGQLVVVEYTGTGTQYGHFGLFPPSNRKTTMRFCDLLRFEDGKLVKIRTYTDLYAPLVQLGHVVSTHRGLTKAS